MLRPFEDQFIDIHTHRKSCRNFVFILRNVFAEEMDNDLLAKQDTYSLGLHPWHIKYGNLESQFRRLNQFAKYPKVLAIGESGLDKKIETPLAEQIEVLKAHITISEKLKKPLIIHNVKSTNELLRIRQESKANIPWIFHGFSGDFEKATKIFDAGCYISIGHLLMNKNSKTFKEFQKFPLDKLFFETDDKSFTVIELYQLAADFKDCYVEKIKEQIFANYKRLFDELTI
ncbi:MAG: TatD family hydrolase [Cytophagia bacterium]|jgi:TatD DNase family protein|nr:TatD family hydrolase [Cytophagia bacterium]